MALKMVGKREHPKHIIGVAAGKGGVGKSSVTALLARSLQKLGFKVGILDADLYGPSLRRMLPESKMPEQIGQKWVPALADGIELMSMGFFRKEGQATVVRAPIANNLIQQFIHQVEWGPLDVLLIDFPPGTGDIQITLSQHAKLTGALIVTTPQEIALMDVRKCIHMFEEVQVPLLGIVENMSYYLDSNQEKVYIFGKGGGKKLAKDFNTHLLGQIPLDPAISSFLDQGKDLLSDSSLSTQALRALFLHLAEDLMAKPLEEFKEIELVWKELSKES